MNNQNKISDIITDRQNEILNKLSRISNYILKDNTEKGKSTQLVWIEVLSAISDDLDSYVECFEHIDHNESQKN